MEIVKQGDDGEQLIPQLSVHVLTGAYNHQTMRVKGSKGTRTLFLLMASGSSHNFLDKKIAKQLGCQLETIPDLKVAAANGNEIVCEAICMKFQWGVHGYQFQADFYILPLDNYDMILGTQGLVELGDIVWNFKKMQMRFKVDQ